MADAFRKNPFIAFVMPSKTSAAQKSKPKPTKGTEIAKRATGAKEPKTMKEVIRTPVLKRLCRRAGVKTASSDAYEEIRAASSDLVERILEKALILMKLEAESKRTLTSKMVRSGIEHVTGHRILGLTGK